jgi:hypothetical protein
MAAIDLSREVLQEAARSDNDAPKAVAIFCAAGLLLSLIFAIYGLDLSNGFF